MKFYQDKVLKKEMIERINGAVVDGAADDNTNNQQNKPNGAAVADDNKNNNDDNKNNNDDQEQQQQQQQQQHDIINVKLLMDWAQQYAPHRVKLIKRSLVAMCNDCTAPYGIMKSWYNGQLNIAKCVFKEHWKRLHNPIFTAIMYVFIFILSLIYLYFIFNLRLIYFCCII